jgi:hypothetical protein
VTALTLALTLTSVEFRAHHLGWGAPAGARRGWMEDPR